LALPELHAPATSQDDPLLGVENMQAWLTAVMGRVCLNLSRSRRARREEPTDFHVPKPVNPLLTQPEALLIFERLDSDRARLREGWPVDNLSFELLENMALISGVEL
jgi:DNA-directed RNA polymerase specialized sigma24 family protein